MPTLLLCVNKSCKKKSPEKQLTPVSHLLT
uniref:Uncharacterized protein n=1 Tax=Anguilla anguilla TaxID=7936 RepID=A0A0E9TW01_ANGAN